MLGSSRTRIMFQRTGTTMYSGGTTAVVCSGGGIAWEALELYCRFQRPGTMMYSEGTTCAI